MAKKRRVATASSAVATVVDTVTASSDNNNRTNNRTTAKELIEQLFHDTSTNRSNAISTTITKGGWCLRQGLLHVASVDNGRLCNLVVQQGLPSFYSVVKSATTTCRHHHEATENISSPSTCFQSLCRIIAGQQLAGKAAQSIWKRLLETTGTASATNKSQQTQREDGLTPQNIVKLAGGPDGTTLETVVQKPSGLSRAKARSILDLALRFELAELTEEFLSNPQTAEQDIRQALLKVKGLGPWSCDMFIMFHLERPNVFPFGDLGVRKGVAKIFDIKNGKAKGGGLCQKKDLERASTCVEPYQPYQSLLTYYMWRAADVQDVYDGEADTGSIAGGGNAEQPVSETPQNYRKRKRTSPRSVTP